LPPRVDTRMVKVGPTHIRVRVTGSAGPAPPLLMVMGIGAHLDMWEPLSEQLAHRQLISFDFPGTGCSGPPLFPATMMHGALLLRLLLRQLKVPRVDVIGYSWGGLLAQQLAAQHPALVRRLILACTGPGITCIPTSLPVAWRLLTPRRYYSPAYLTEIAPDTYGGQFRTDRELVDADVARRVEHPPSWLGYAHQIAASASFSSFVVGPMISAPTLILAGSDDPLVRTANQHILRSLIRGSDLRVFEGAGHMLLLERPAEVRPWIDDFLSGSATLEAGHTLIKGGISRTI
jgi:pimeloyl-ACP methyl ester carboxylesterase